MKKTSRTFKRFAAITSASLLAACMVAPMYSFAVDEETTYTITINNTVAGHTYEAYQIFAGDLSTDQKTLSNVEWGTGIAITDEVLSELAEINDVFKKSVYSISDEETDLKASYETWKTEQQTAGADASVKAYYDTIADETTKAKFTITKEAYTTSDADVASKIAEALSEKNDDATARAFANAVSKCLSTAPTASTNAHVDTTDDEDETANGYVISGEDVTAGYYLIKDKDASQNKENGAYTSFILKVVKNERTDVKTGLPSVVKKVQENTNVDDYNENGETRNDYNDVADYSIGDDVPFALYGTMPDNISSYSTYKYIFHDTLSDGLAYNSDVKVTIGSQEVSSDYYSPTITGNKLDISFDDVLALKDKDGADIAITKSSVIRVDYTAKLDTDAKIGLPGNPNEVYLEYSNNPNAGGEGDTGTTTKDQVIVFTYGIDITKVDQADKSITLTDAKFLLYNSEKTMSAKIEGGIFRGWVEGDAGDELTGSPITIKGLDDGTYFMKEIKAPDGYNLPAGDNAYFEVLVNAETVNNQSWAGTPSEALKSLAADKESDWDVDVEITNTKGSTLPGTGGIGTTVFYLGGGAMVAVAGIYLISKKRMKNTQE